MGFKNLTRIFTAILIVANWNVMWAVNPADSLKTGSTLSSEKIMLLKTAWAESSNAASLSFFDYQNKIGNVYLGFAQEEGDYRLFQEAKAENKYGFFTSGYVKLGKWDFFGNFNYYSENDKEIKWADVLEPYNDNPYNIGDSIGGNYFKEYFKMEAKGAYRLGAITTLGFDVKYKTGVGAKRKDPRPENVITSFEFMPAVIFNFNKIKLGANLRYMGGKEDTEISTVTGNSFDIFYFRGLGVFSSTLEEDDRTDELNLYGGGLQFCFDGDGISCVTEINSSKQITDIKRGTSYPVQIVSLEKYNTEVAATLNFTSSGKKVNKLKFSYNDKRVYGLEPVLESVAEEVTYQWSSVAKYTLYWNKEKEYGFNYSYYKLIDASHFNWGGSLSGKLLSANTTYYFVPEFNKQKINQFSLDAVIEKGFSFASNQLVVSLNGGYRSGFDCSLDVVEVEELLNTVNTGFVNHDFEYQKAGLFETGASVKLGRDIVVYKYPIQLFAEAEYKRISSDFSDKTHRNLLQVNVGMNF